MRTSLKSFIVTSLLILLSYSQTMATEPLRKGFTIKFAYNIPQTDFGALQPEPLFYNLETMGSGFGVDLGYMYFIQAIDIGDQMKIGIDVTYLSLNYQKNTMSLNRTYFDENGRRIIPSENEFDAYYITIMAEAGPSFSYSPVEKMVLDVAFKISPTIGLTGAEYSFTNGDSHSYFGNDFGWRYTPAFYFRYSKLLLGVEYNIGDLDFNMEYSGGASGPSTANVPYNTLRILLGLKL